MATYVFRPQDTAEVARLIADPAIVEEVRDSLAHNFTVVVGTAVDAIVVRRVDSRSVAIAGISLRGKPLRWGCVVDVNHWVPVSHVYPPPAPCDAEIMALANAGLEVGP